MHCIASPTYLTNGAEGSASGIDTELRFHVIVSVVSSAGNKESSFIMILLIYREVNLAS